MKKMLKKIFDLADRLLNLILMLIMMMKIIIIIKKYDDNEDNVDKC